LLVNNSEQNLDGTFAALSHPIRRGIVARLSQGDATVSELARPYDVSAPAISKHMRVLEEAGLVVRRKSGREHHCRLDTERMRAAGEWIERYRQQWSDRLDRLEQYLKENP
jgi:DNA-binding transcriptional ArsR family regulator